MDWFGTIPEQIHELRCPTCGTRLEQGMVRGVASENQRVLVQIACARCGESSIAVIERADETSRAEPRLTVDDVLDAHDFLAGFDGPLSQVLGGL